MIYSMAAAGEAPRSLARTTSKGIPLNTLKLCAIILLAGSLLGLIAQDQLFRVLMAVPGFVVVLVWICICFSQLKLRKAYPVRPALRYGVPLYNRGNCALPVCDRCPVFDRRAEPGQHQRMFVRPAAIGCLVHHEIQKRQQNRITERMLCFNFTVIGQA